MLAARVQMRAARGVGKNKTRWHDAPHPGSKNKMNALFSASRLSLRSCAPLVQGVDQRGIR
jgi:hypothetical protein